MLQDLLHELGMLVIPLACPGCGEPDIQLCGGCLAWLAGPLRRVEHSVPRLDYLTGEPVMPVWALGEYVESARGTIVAWKDRGREDLTGIFARALEMELEASSSCHIPPIDLIVPMPSSAASVRERGRRHLWPIARVVARSLGARPLGVLRKGGTRDQVGLSARARGTASIEVRRRFRQGNLAPLVIGSRCLLFDDVVTTGATLAAARDALVAEGMEVVGALVLAATPPRPGHNVGRDGGD
ncbi:MAG: ComF family protein [Promicromonosporaceae bacterium]|nr:ComF family protein [Promicromonosporaceae bacterium]